ncbi:hypothetical protein AVEN_10261-1 [Araneus ventricosus]|uniref:Uncharacterized protein n=1 Tax=Araneus ventricosus TaxID=182803 RepID=A0A4Y2UFX6_ARAVE|nr:hypothetical protein AVEN_10261-1 [Araneus ventricosus]
MRNTEGRYKISRLNKRSIKCRTVHQRETISDEMLSAKHGLKKRPFVALSSKFRNWDSQTKNDGRSTLPSYLRLSRNYSFTEDRGVVVVLPPGDSSSSWTNHPTAVVCLPSWC